MNQICFENTSEYLQSVCDYVVTQWNALSSIMNETEFQISLLDVPRLSLPRACCLCLEQSLHQFAQQCHNTNIQSVDLPLYMLISNLKLPRPEAQMLMTALAWEYKFSFAQEVSSSKQFKDMETPTLLLASLLLRTQIRLDLNNSFWEKVDDAFALFFQPVAKLDLYSPLRLKENVLAYLLNVPCPTPHYAKRYCCKKNVLAPANSSMLLFSGAKGSGRKHRVKQEADNQNRDVLFVKMPVLDAMKQDSLKEAQQYLLSEAVVHHLAICFEDYEYSKTKIEYFIEYVEKLKKHNVPIYLTCTEAASAELRNVLPVFVYQVPALTKAEQKELWEQILPASLLDADVNFSQLVSKFSLTPEQILNAAREAKAVSQKISAHALTSCCYGQSAMLLSQNAEKITPVFTWEDLVLPKDLQARIQQGLNHIKLKYSVYSEWHFDEKMVYGKGISMLFTGPPGTGKTMLAQVIANDLDMLLYRADMSAVVSKYIGETEKNLSIIFSAAAKSNAILFFDEMDSLFGKRSETQDAHDKYANMETAYILQEIENYEGIVLMATNYIGNIDTAFFRRIKFVFHVPLPSQKDRLSLWKKSFPKEAPLEDAIDFQYLSEGFELSGASIKNIALSAAFLAAQEGTCITMRQIMEALRYETSKQGKIMLRNEFGKYAYLLEGLM